MTFVWEDLEHVELRAGTIVRAEPFTGALTPACQLWIDFGDEIGTRRGSAPLSDLERIDELVGTQVICVTNFEARAVDPVATETLMTSFYRDDGAIVLAQPESEVPNGARLA